MNTNTVIAYENDIKRVLTIPYGDHYFKLIDKKTLYRRDDKPALLLFNHNKQLIKKEYYNIKGMLHRTVDEPSIITYYENGNVEMEAYFKYDLLHRDDITLSSQYRYSRNKPQQSLAWATSIFGYTIPWFFNSEIRPSVNAYDDFIIELYCLDNINQKVNMILLNKDSGNALIEKYCKTIIKNLNYYKDGI